MEADPALMSVLTVGRLGPQIGLVLVAAGVLSAGTIAAFIGEPSQFVTLITTAASRVMPPDELEAIPDLDDRLRDLLFWVRGVEITLQQAAVLNAEHPVTEFPLNAQVAPLWSAQCDPKKRRRFGLAERSISAPSANSLRDQEAEARREAAFELRTLLREAGSAATITQRVSDLAPAEADRVMDLILSRGSPSTIKRHVALWKSIRGWIVSQGKPLEAAYPPSEALIASYLLERSSSGCGPSVPDTVRGNVAWICDRLGMTAPDLAAPSIRAIRDQVVTDRGRPVREAVPFPLDVIRAFEAMAAGAGSQHLPTCFRIVSGMCLCMIYASLRFNDAVHTEVRSVVFTDDVLRGTCWQTKADRKRRGTRFAIVNSSFGSIPWLPAWWAWVSPLLTHDADFWFLHVSIDTIGVMTVDWASPAAFGPALTVLRAAIEHAVLMDPAVDQAFASQATWHSARVTMIDLAGLDGRSSTEMLLQLHSTSPAMAEKYQRSRLQIPINMVHDLCKKARTAWAPSACGPLAEALDQAEAGEPEVTSPADALAAAVAETSGSSSSDSEPEVISEDELPVIFMKAPNPSRSASGERNLRLHIPDRNITGMMACRAPSVTTDGMIPAGIPGLPSDHKVCERCLAARPDIARRLRRGSGQ